MFLNRSELLSVFSLSFYLGLMQYGILGRWLSEVYALDMKNFDTHLVSTPHTFNSELQISTKSKMLRFGFSGLGKYLRPGKVPFSIGEKTNNNVWLTKWVIINIMLLFIELEVHTRNYCTLIEIRNEFFNLIGWEAVRT